jgi:uncharacterized membrane protein YfhO
LWLATRRRFWGDARVLYATLAAAIIVNYASFIAVNDALLPAGERAGHPTGVDYYARHILQSDSPAFSGTTYTHRVDAPPKLRNYGMQINQPSITSFHSLRSSYLDEFVTRTGFGHTESPDAVPPSASDGAIRALLGVKIYYNYDEENFPGAPEGFVYTGKQGDVAVYENTNALPLGFAYDFYSTPYHYPLEPDTAGAVMLQGVMLREPVAEKLGDILLPLWKQEHVPWQEAARQRAAQSCYDVIATPAGLSAKIDLPREQLVFFSVQFDRGWSAKVNGAPVELHDVNMGCIGLRVPAGEANEIALTYRPRGLSEGILVSGLAAAALILYVFWMRRRAAGPAIAQQNGC